MPGGGVLKRIAFVPARRHDANSTDPFSLGFTPLNDPLEASWPLVSSCACTKRLVQRDCLLVYHVIR